MNYYQTQRVVEDTVLIGNQTFTVQATWREEEGDVEKVDVRITGPNAQRFTYLGLDDGGLQQFAEVFLTVCRAVRTESVQTDVPV